MRRFLAVSAVVVFLVSVVGIFLTFFPATTTTSGRAVASSEPAQAQTTPPSIMAEPQPPVLPRDQVAPFMPNKVGVYRVDAMGRPIVEILPALSMDANPAQMLYVDRNGDVRNAAGGLGPRSDVPGLLKFEFDGAPKRRVLPGEAGTVQVIGHSGPGQYFQPLLDNLQEGGADIYGGGDFRFTLSGEQGQSITYAIDQVCMYAKGDPQPCNDPSFYDNRVDVGILTLCERPVQGTVATHERVVVGHIISSVAA